jgi:excinuclease UvrABC ATPase subunit
MSQASDFTHYLVDLGPYAGSEGGKIVYEGDFTGLLRADTLTGNHLLRKRPPVFIPPGNKRCDLYDQQNEQFMTVSQLGTGFR